MRAARTEYAVPGWGTGELWTGDGVVLAHEFDFDHPGAASRAAPLQGARVPPTSTVPRDSARVGHDLAPSSQQASPDGGGSRAAGHHLEAGDLVARFRAFFAGEDARLHDVPVDLDWATPFQRAVAVTLRDIPRGEVVSYGELAALAGYPGAARAVGTFCAQNRLMLLVPCHRVVGAAGLGGYGSAGLGVKRRLLALEGVHL